jgi:hypothetical protein
LQSGCDLSVQNQGNPNVGGATQLLWSGAKTSLLAGSCQSYTITAADNTGAATAVSGEVILSLSGGGSGSFYSNPSCAGDAVSQVVVPAGASSVTISFLDSLAEFPIFVAEANALNPGAAAISVNSSSRVYAPAGSLITGDSSDIYVCGVDSSGTFSD